MWRHLSPGRRDGADVGGKEREGETDCRVSFCSIVPSGAAAAADGVISDGTSTASTLQLTCIVYVSGSQWSTALL